MKRFTFRTYVSPYWVSVYLTYWGDEAWNIGACINKSKRASNDWDRRRHKRKRVKRTTGTVNRSTLKHLYALKRNVVKAISKVPTGHGVAICPEDERRNALGKFVERFGFIYHLSDAGPLWVLVIHPELEE